MHKHMIISLMSKDRPGIIADITGAIFKLGGDLADLNQTILCGYLTMILSASFDPDITKEDVVAAVSHIKSPYKFEVSIKETDEDPPLEEPPAETYILTVQGPNRAGIVHGISSFCYRHNINITDLATTLKNNLYSMALQLDIRHCDVSLDLLRQDLQNYAKDNSLTVAIQHNDIFMATHEVSLR